MSASTNLIELFLLLATMFVALPALVLLLEVLSAPRRLDAELDAIGPPREVRVAVLVPAHNEAGGIAPTLLSILAQCRPGDRLLVVADNCSDDTAALARAIGAEVIERVDTTQRGKGYALDYGVRHIETWLVAPEVAVIVDADCTLGAHALDRLALAASSSGRPVQARYLMHAPSGAALKVRIAEFAWIVKNAVRPAGLAALALPCQLMGSGMAFPWQILRGAPLANGHLVEDMKLGVELALAGHPPMFCAAARVDSQFPSHVEGLESQRRRWEQGHLSVITQLGIPLVGKAIWRAKRPLFCMALDLCVPPLASLVVLNLLVFSAGIALALVSGQWFAAALPLAAFSFLLFAVTIAWARWGRAVVSASDFLAVPGYVIGKLPIYFASMTGRSEGWVRTRRDAESTSANASGDTKTKPPSACNGCER